MTPRQQLEQALDYISDQGSFTALQYDTGKHCCLVGALNRTWPGAIGMLAGMRHINLVGKTYESEAYRYLRKAASGPSFYNEFFNDPESTVMRANTEGGRRKAHIVAIQLLDKAIAFAREDENKIADEAEAIARDGSPTVKEEVAA
jgi:hypothetical protein